MPVGSLNDPSIVEKNKKIAALFYKMSDGEITEDEFKEQVEQLQGIINNRKGKLSKPLEEVGLSNNEEKQNKETYGEYFHKNKTEFKNILGL